MDRTLYLLAMTVFALVGVFYIAIGVPHPAGTSMGVRVAPDMFPDPTKTPGATNPAVTQSTIAETICSGAWSTKSVRDTQSSVGQKNQLYGTYGIPKPAHNSGANQECELDHLISLELGGSDALSNVWPQCDFRNVPLGERYFKDKDAVENYLHTLVCSNKITLKAAQQAIVSNWYAIYESMVGPGKAGAILDTSDEDDN